jgi:hypothetical protein
LGGVAFFFAIFPLPRPLDNYHSERSRPTLFPPSVPFTPDSSRGATGAPAPSRTSAPSRALCAMNLSALFLSPCHSLSSRPKGRRLCGPQWRDPLHPAHRIIDQLEGCRPEIESRKAVFRQQEATTAHLVEIAPQRIVHDDGSAIGKGLDRMTDITRHDRD